MNIDHLFETEQPLTGFVDIQTLSHLLPDITNVPEFDSAIDKLRIGHGDQLTIPEKLQLALAFISLIRLNPPQKMLAIRKMMSVQSAAPTQPRQMAPQQQVVPPAAQNTQPAQAIPNPSPA